MTPDSDTGHEVRSRLSEYLDGELAGRDREAVEHHLATCGECRGVLEAVATVRARARSLENRPPERDLWPGIRDALDGATVIDLSEHLHHSDTGPEPTHRRRRVVLSLPQLAAAAAVVVVLASAGTWGVARTVTAPAAPAGGVVFRPLPPAEEGSGPGEGGATAAAWVPYDGELAELHEILRRDGGRLSPKTVRILEKNLLLVEAAIRESEAALARDPGNPFVERHLQRSVERKMDYLRDAAALLETTD